MYLTECFVAQQVRGKRVAQVEEIKNRIFSTAHKKHPKKYGYHKAPEHKIKAEAPRGLRHDVDDRQVPHTEVRFDSVVDKRVGRLQLARIAPARSPKLDLRAILRKSLHNPHHVRGHGLFRRDAPMGYAYYFHSYPFLILSSISIIIARRPSR